MLEEVAVVVASVMKTNRNVSQIGPADQRLRTNSLLESQTVQEPRAVEHERRQERVGALAAGDPVTVTLSPLVVTLMPLVTALARPLLVSSSV